ncbi:MAG: AraC family transcriptional regulator [Woeseiaceae bacterium]|nr:AraC family transcriptional regulator [Woeseiaceae bacterium]
MPDVLDIVFRTVTITAALILATLLLTTGRRRPAALPGALLCLAAAAFFVTSAPGASAALGAWDYPLTALCVTKAVWFWLLARALFTDEARLRGRHVAVAGGIALFGAWQQEVFLAEFRAGSAGTLETIAGFGFEGVLLLFVLLGLYEAGRDLGVDLVERRRRLRVGFIVATGAYLTMTLAVQSFNLFLGVATPQAAKFANMLVVTAACLAAAWSLLKLRQESWLDPAVTSAPVALSPQEAAALARLERRLEADRIFLEEGLTIGKLASHLGCGEHVLRRVINRGMGYRNFNDFLHAWRIREACEELARPEQARLPVLSIAMKVGYGSIGSFNRAFKARIGMTPTDYRRSAVAGAARAR